MIVKEYIKEFEKLGFGMFVHFGLYSLLGRGEWVEKNCQLDRGEYESLANHFVPNPNWAQELAATAKQAGCRYITLTTRHHDGFSLYDTCGLNDFDSCHFCGRDLVREFVDACRAQEIIPFFYHTLLDWREESYKTDFPAYLNYLRASVELLCKNYGKIGGLWFDGMWDKPDADWEEDRLYGTIRTWQPDAMIINNTGLSSRGALGHIELDSVTFEAGRPGPINLEGAPKYIASEMCQILCTHWGYARRDFNYKSAATIIQDLCACRKYGANFLLNVGPMGDGNLRTIDRGTLEVLGQWVEIFGEALYTPRPSGIQVTGAAGDFLLRSGNDYYLFVHDVGRTGDINETLEAGDGGQVRFNMPERISRAVWLDNGEAVTYTQEGGTLTLTPPKFCYGEHLVVRVAKFTAENKM